MPKRNSVHTTPNPNGSGWVNQSNGVIISRHHTQRAAIERGRTASIGNSAEHVIHRPNGQIRESNSYGNDPYPPRG